MKIAPFDYEHFDGQISNITNELRDCERLAAKYPNREFHINVENLRGSLRDAEKDKRFAWARYQEQLQEREKRRQAKTEAEIEINLINITEDLYRSVTREPKMDPAIGREQSWFKTECGRIFVSLMRSEWKFSDNTTCDQYGYSIICRGMDGKYSRYSQKFDFLDDAEERDLQLYELLIQIWRW
jgi:hypothetical protein